MIVGTGTSSNLVPTSSNLVPDEVREDSSNLVPYSPRRGREDEVRGGLGAALKTTLETRESGTRFDCVRCGIEVGPGLMLCPACYAKTRTGKRLAAAPHAATSPAGLCPSCGGRLASGKCGWC